MEATWEFVDEIRRRFPTFSLEDEGTEGGVAVMKKKSKQGNRELGKLEGKVITRIN